MQSDAFLRETFAAGFAIFAVLLLFWTLPQSRKGFRKERKAKLRQYPRFLKLDVRSCRSIISDRFYRIHQEAHQFGVQH